MQVKVTVILDSSLKKYSTLENGQIILEMSEGSIIKDIIDKLEILQGEVGVILHNSTISTQDTILKHGDVIKLFPIFGGG